jgi:polyisoprenoid-binding protein YceI
VARYEIDPTRSRVFIHASSSVHPIHSETEGLEGWLDLEIGSGGRPDVTVAPSARLSLAVAKLRSGNLLEDRELLRRIDAKRFPTIEGSLTELTEPGEDGRGAARGDVTFRGVTRSCAGELTITSADGHTIHVEGQARFDVRDFGMDPPRILMLRVHPEVDVRIDVVATRGELSKGG